MVYLLIHYCG